MCVCVCESDWPYLVLRYPYTATESTQGTRLDAAVKGALEASGSKARRS